MGEERKMESIFDPGISLILFLQSMAAWLVPVMEFFTFLGNEEFFLLIMPAIFWCVSPALGLRVGLLLLTSAGLNSALKLAFVGPRPYWIDLRVDALTTETSFGVPSGHAMNAASVWGGLAVSLRKRWAWPVALFLIFMVGVSRMFMGMHFPHDILLGWLFGGMLVLAYIRLEKPVAKWLQSFNLPLQVGIIFTATLVLIGLGLLARFAQADLTIPQAWYTNAQLAHPDGEAIHPLALASLFNYGGAVFGFSLGLLWLQQAGGFDAGGPWEKRLLRFILGVIGVLLIWRGLGLVLPGGENLAGYFFRYLRYGLIGFWISGLAPQLFLALGLAGRKAAALKLALNQ
jgi:membrane-associated phospholipid phosphatase